MDIEKIKEKIINGDYNYTLKIPNIISLTHIFDEDLSVRQNREMAEEHNQKVKQMREKLFQERAKRYQQLRQDVVNYIVEDYKVTLNQANIIEDFAYAQKGDEVMSYLCYIDDVATLAESLFDSNHSYK
jgi:hypothetical protein